MGHCVRETASGAGGSRGGLPVERLSGGGHGGGRLLCQPAGPASHGAAFFFLAVAARAARVHPTSARLAGLLLVAGTLALVAVATWTGVVAPYAAMQYHAASDQMRRHALLIEAHLNEHVVLLGFWCFLGFTAAGLYFLGRALRGERGWTADALKIAAALLALHLPTWLYVAQESLLNDNYVRWLAVVDQLLLWGSLAAAFYFGARWLRHVGRSLPT